MGRRFQWDGVVTLTLALSMLSCAPRALAADESGSTLIESLSGSTLLLLLVGVGMLVFIGARRRQD
jgi:hypothetical protein